MAEWRTGAVARAFTKDGDVGAMAMLLECDAVGGMNNSLDAGVRIVQQSRRQKPAEAGKGY